MPVAHRGVGFARRHTAAPTGPNNNATDVTLWSVYSSFTGNPLDGNGLVKMTDAKVAEWATQRMIGGPAHATLGGFIHSGVEMETIRGGNRYNDDGTLITGADTSAAAWSQQALKNGWNSNTQTWFQRVAALGLRAPSVAMHSFNAASSILGFECLWNDNAVWGASTVAGALTPTVGSRLEDYIRYTKAAYAAGFRGQYFDLEQNGDWAAPQSGNTVQQTRDFVMLRARQMALITATHMPTVGGPEMGIYKVGFTGSNKELIFYKTANGSQPENIFDYSVTDTFLAGLATEPGIRVVNLVEEDFYRLDVSHFLGDSSANDSDRTRIDNAFLLDFGRRRARLSQVLAFATALTDADRLAAMRKLKNCAFIWPADAENAGSQPHTPTNWDRLLDGATRWSQDRIFQYQRGGVNQQQETAPDNDIDEYEASYTSRLVPAHIEDPPTVTITSPVSPHSSAGANVTVQLSVTVATAVDRIEVVNQTTGVTYFVPFRWMHDDPANWDPLNAAKRPNNTSLGLVPFHVEAGFEAPNTIGVGVAIPRAVGANTIVVNVYSIHQMLGTATLVSTRTFAFDFAGTNGAVPSGWTPVAGTVDIQSDKMRTQTAASTLAVAGAYLTDTLPFQDYEWTGADVITTVTAADFYGSINTRATGVAFTDMMHNTGWHLRWVGASGAAELYRISGAGAQTFLTSGASAGFVQGSILRWRLRIVGQNFKLRYWLNAAAEPGTWQIDYTDTSAPTGNRVSAFARNGAAATADRWDRDDYTITAIAGSAPVADFTVSANPAPNVATTFTDISTNTPTQWAWAFGDGGTSTAQNPTHTYTAVGTYNVQLTATNAAGSNAITKSVGVAAGSSNPSGQSPPSGNISGWNLSWVEDFNTNSAEGTWGPTEFVVPAAYAAHFGVYEDGWFDTSSSIGENASSRYMPTQVLSTSNSCLQWRLFNSGSGARSAAVEVGTNVDSCRVAMRFRAESVDGFKTAWLFWPASGNWPPDGEIDFPEGSLQGGTIQGYMHRQGATSGSDQDFGDSGQNYQSWHTAVIEWEDGVRCKFILDGTTILDITSRVPNTPMHFVLQTESDLGSNQPPTGTSGLMFLDWIAYYTRV